jgi:hypothetical protein
MLTGIQIALHLKRRVRVFSLFLLVESMEPSGLAVGGAW